MAVFRSDTVQIAHDISVVYSPAAGSNVITLVDNNPIQIRNKFGLESVKGVANGLLDELRCYASISSLPEISLPELTLDDSESQRLAKAQSFEWNTARFELVVFKKAKNSADWAEFGVSALKHAGGFRYRIHRILDLTTDNIGARVGEGGKIGVAIRAVGYGYPQAFDRISFTGHWVQEFTWVQELPPAVVVNNYGSGGSPSPSPTPTPVTPIFTLSLPDGKTSAVANNSDQIILTTTGIPAGTGVSGTWWKGSTNLNISESISILSGGIVLLNSNKLAASGAGSYKLKITYQGTEYTTNEIAVTINPEITVTITSTLSGDTAFFVVGDTFALDIQGRYFTPNATLNFTWYRGSTALTNTGTVTTNSSGSFTLNQTSSNAQFYSSSGGSKEGLYRLRVVDGSLNIDSNAIYGADRMPDVVLSPTSSSIAANSNVVVQISRFNVNDVLTATWIKNDIELTTTASQQTYTENGGNPFSGYFYTYSVPSGQFANSPYGGAGTYKLKVLKNGTPVKKISGAITITA